MKFSLTIDGTTFNFDLDKYGQIWHLEENVDLGVFKNAFNHEPTHNINDAKKIAEDMLYSKGLLG